MFTSALMAKSRPVNASTLPKRHGIETTLTQILICPPNGLIDTIACLRVFNDYMPRKQARSLVLDNEGDKSGASVSLTGWKKS